MIKQGLANCICFFTLFRVAPHDTDLNDRTS
jgi:hypothetical protein